MNLCSKLLQCIGLDKDNLHSCDGLVQLHSTPIQKFPRKPWGRPWVDNCTPQWVKPTHTNCGRPHKKLQGYQHKYGIRGNKSTFKSPKSPVCRNMLS